MTVLLKHQFITTKAPDLIRKSEDDIAAVERTLERLREEEDHLLGDVCNHMADVQPLVAMLAMMTEQIQELERYSQYLHCLAQIEDLRLEMCSKRFVKTGMSFPPKAHYAFPSCLLYS